MQDSNYLRLMTHVAEAVGRGFAPSRVLDVGCGDGQAASAAFGESGLPPKGLFGVDPALRLLRYGRELGTDLISTAGDARRLPYRDGSFGCVLSNSVLHWLNFPERGLSPLPAVREVRRVLWDGGVFGASIAADETAVDIGRSYHRVATSYRDRGYALTANYRHDPVGGMSLPAVVDHFITAGLTVSRAAVEYEPVWYPSAEEYVSDVRSYGFGAFSAAFPEAVREAAFTAIEQDFLKHHGRGEYTHRQYMLYIVAKLGDG